MNYSAELRITSQNPDDILRISRMESGKRDRATLRVKKQGNDVVFDIKATDATALKAATNNILKLITIIEKTKAIKNER